MESGDGICETETCDGSSGPEILVGTNSEIAEEVNGGSSETEEEVGGGNSETEEEVGGGNSDPEIITGDNEGSTTKEKIIEDVQEKVQIHVGMLFQSAEQVFEHFKEYARQVGFPVRKRSSHKGDDGVVKYVRYTCGREGNLKSKSSNSLKPRPTSGVGCMVKVSARLVEDGTWQIIHCFLDHNHDISPSKARLFKCYRKMSEKDKRDLVMRDEAGIRLPPSFRVSVVEKGSYENVPYISKDARNYVEKMRRLRLGEGDAMALRNYFLRMQKQNKDFYFNIQLDEEHRLENVFWADARSRLAYQEFGEVVTFDTTYLTNRYDMPFAPFVGVNHHGQSTLFGCGLVSHETTSNFIWLFNSWLTCMHGVAPRGIITDQDRAMQNAIHIVFPDTVHRWCLWHIMKKIPEKLNGYTDHELISKDLHDAVYDSQQPDDFEKSWNEMIVRYQLEDNEWLRGLYAERCRWVPIYVKTTFWAGMSTTQRSEGMNAFFDIYVDHKTTLKQFVEKYDCALRSKIEKETQEDHRSMSKMIPITTTWEMEKQVQSVYTLTKFREFQNELHGQGYCSTISRVQDGPNLVYSVKDRTTYADGLKKVVIFTVMFNSDSSEAECSCHKFEYRGIICRHVIYVYKENDVEIIPEKYILRRWRKDVRRPHSRILVTNQGWVVTAEYKRYNDMCTILTEISDMASLDEEDTQEVLEWAKNQKIRLQRQKSKSGSNSSHSNPCKINDNVEIPMSDTSILDPCITRRKGRPAPTSRFTHPGEKAVKKAKKNKAKAVKEGKEGKGGGKRSKGKKPKDAMSVEEVTQTQDSISCGIHPTQENTPYTPYFPNANMNQVGGEGSTMHVNPTCYEFLELMDPDMDSLYQR